MADGRDDSGVIDLEALLREASSRAPAPPTETRSQLDDLPLASPLGQPLLPPQLDSLAAMTSDTTTEPQLPATAPSAPSAPRPEADSTRRQVRSVAIGAVLVGLALGATTAGLRTHGGVGAAPTVGAGKASARAEAALAPALMKPATGTVGSPALAAAVGPSAGVPARVAPTSLSTGGAAAPRAAGSPRSALAPKSDSPAPAPAEPVASEAPAPPRAPAQEPSAAPEPPAADTSAAATPAVAPATSDLGDAMREVVRREDGAKPEPSTASTPTQLRPSAGAVNGAIRTVLPAARACLGAGERERSVSVVFRSDGSVARVELFGNAPEDDCVRGALARAKLSPFADESFSVRITVRP